MCAPLLAKVDRRTNACGRRRARLAAPDALRYLKRPVHLMQRLRLPRALQWQTDDSEPLTPRENDLTMPLERMPS